jgi:hypothetical protein
MPQYAANTEVSSYKSREEIERTLAKYGAQEFAYGTTQGKALIGFTLRDRQIRFVLQLPDRHSQEFTLTPAKRFKRTVEEADKAYEQAVRAHWRSLKIVILAKLEAVERGIVTFEQEFGMHMVLPGGVSVAEMITPAIERAYDEGGPEPLLTVLGAGYRALPRGSA